MNSKKKIIYIISLSILLFCLFQCGKDETSNKVKIDLPEIRARDTLKAIISYGLSNYFLYKGQPMGFEYELMTLLANDLNIKLKLVIADNLDNFFDMVRKGEGDIVAHNLTITKQRKEIVDFTDTHVFTKQVLVQRKPNNWRELPIHVTEQKLINNVLELEGKTVVVRKESSYYERLLYLQREIGGKINIQLAKGETTTEELIKMVADGKIDYTIADENIAAINKTYLPILDINTPISLIQRTGWVIRKSSPMLRDTINAWLKQIKSEPTYNVLITKYFKDSKSFKVRVNSDLFSLETGNISLYDEIVKKNAEIINWDWRLLSSLIYQESQFENTAESWAGAKGLMQMTSKTAEEFGVTNIYDPEDCIRGGVKYLKFLQKLWAKIEEPSEEIKFVLASYNVGQNHVEDARKLANKLNKDPNIWQDNVESCLLLLSNPQYYNLDIIEYGYCRADEPVEYVKEIFERLEHYKKFVD